MSLKIAMAENAVAVSRGRARESRYRLGYHISAEANWINDPNGLIFFNGEYHAFFQHHPFSPQWGPMHWGHVKSKDLVHWEHLPIALAPTEGPDEGGCFSGSAVESNGVLTLIYTGHCDWRSPKEVQCLASSFDGIRFEKWTGNPVIEAPPLEGSDDFRDPKVWRHGDYWYMVVGSGKDGIGKALIYRSENLRQWNFMGVAAESDGTMGFMWECPDLFRLGDKDVLVCSPIGMEGHKNIYMIGLFDYDSCRFNIESVGELDFGRDHYAAQSFEDDQGRRIQIAWMHWGRPIPTEEEGWAGALTLPRLLTLGEDGKLRTRPVRELESLRKSHRRYENFSGKLSVEVMSEIKVILDIASCPNGLFGFSIGRAVITYDGVAGIVKVDIDKGDKGGGGISQVPVAEGKETLELHLFIDRSSLELFVGDGEAVITNRIYPEEENLSLDFIYNQEAIRPIYIDIYALDSIW